MKLRWPLRIVYPKPPSARARIVDADGEAISPIMSQRAAKHLLRAFEQVKLDSMARGDDVGKKESA